MALGLWAVAVAAGAATHAPTRGLHPRAAVVRQAVLRAAPTARSPERRPREPVAELALDEAPPPNQREAPGPLAATLEPDAAALFDGVAPAAPWVEFEPALGEATALLESGPLQERVIEMARAGEAAPKKAASLSSSAARRAFAARGARSRLEPAPWDKSVQALRILPSGRGRLNALATSLSSEPRYAIFYSPKYLARVGGASAAVDLGNRMLFVSEDAVVRDDPDGPDMAHELRHIEIGLLEDAGAAHALMGSVSAGLGERVHASGADSFGFDEPEAYAAGVRRAAARLAEAVEAEDAAAARRELKALGMQAYYGAVISGEISRLAATLARRALSGRPALYARPADGEAAAAVATMTWNDRTRGASRLALPLAASLGPDDPRNRSLFEGQLRALQRAANAYLSAFERLLGPVNAIVRRAVP